MSLQDSVSKSSGKLEHLPTGSKIRKEGSGGPDPADLEIGPSSAPTHNVPLQGQEFDVMWKMVS